MQQRDMTESQFTVQSRSASECKIKLLFSLNSRSLNLFILIISFAKLCIFLLDILTIKDIVLQNYLTFIVYYKKLH